ncbi:hypothetical protein [Botryobacter ruber]|uniref:hypothetical protein n=1 Tax=Botryobacter ruber TaxID=2171629 RepID=UPI000FEC4629|nr:hypothetical protein [Botryobacter ruber]
MKHVTFALIFFFASTALFAQTTTASAVQQDPKAGQSTNKTLEQRADEITAGMVKHLHLSGEQAKKVRAINLANMQHAEAARVKYKNDPKQFAHQMEIISETRLQQIKEALTQQQFEQYQARREEKMGVPREARSNPGARQQESSYQNQY